MVLFLFHPTPGQPLGHPSTTELFLVMVLFTTAKFFFTLDLDLDLTGVGDVYEDRDTFISRLETNGITHFRNFPRTQSSSESRSLSLFPLSNNKSLHPIISLSKFQPLSGVLIDTIRIDLKKQDLRVFILQNGRVKVPRRATFAAPIVFLEDHSIVQLSSSRLP